ncbi:hypothetical protein [Paenibacillus sp. L3-i20]|uniref:hypothetical protein n=1 Tax=Paenibacillus sp. L3-i20 TaxID=2905833 RepID=UPI001EDFD00A|nr:hypothetical protein [Paenibacillus sp. L3-i20]GKU77913.1 hypothetical protein L3i20_v223100 [Paenibacillus sp. L3-i20]
MNQQLKYFLITLVSVLIIGIGMIMVINEISKLEIVRALGSFKVEIHNESDHDLTFVEIGTVTSASREKENEGNSKDVFKKEIRSGEKRTIKPNLSITGEGGIYLTYIDSKGNTASASVCSYTESISGYSTAIITNDEIKVEENCS